MGARTVLDEPWAALLRLAAGPTAEPDEVLQLAASGDQWEARAGEVLVEQGHVSRQGFVVLSGTATVLAGGTPVARLAPGSAVWPAEARVIEMPITVVADGHMWLLMLAPTDQKPFRRSHRG